MKDQQEDKQWFQQEEPPELNVVVKWSPQGNIEDIKPKETFQKFNWKHQEEYRHGGEDMGELESLSRKLADDTITYKERMRMAILILQREIDGYIEESFYKDRYGYMRNSVGEVLEMPLFEKESVLPISTVPNVDLMSDEEKWKVFEDRYEQTRSIPKLPISPRERPNK